MAIIETKAFSYAVRNDATSVAATVTIGDGQAGSWAIALGRTVIAKGRQPKRVRIGIGSDLLGKSMTVSTNVRDLNPNTNRLSVTTTLQGGVTEKECTHSRNGRQGESALFTSIVFFR